MKDLTYIPEAVEREINEKFGHQPFIRNRAPDEMTKTVRLEYQKIEPLREATEIVDPTTFTPIIVDGTTHQYVTPYYVRVSGSDVIAVRSPGRCISPK